MPAFLEQLVDELYDHFNGELSGLCLVFPTRRAGLFFRQHLSRKLTKPGWIPVIYSIQDFIRSFSTSVVPDQLALMFELFEVYKNYFPDEPFEKFYPWGEMLLNDFDEADRNLADTRQLFAYIRDEREIDSLFELAEEDVDRIRTFWKTFFNKEPGKLKNEFMANWKHLGSMYNDYREKLAAKNWAYEGLAYRQVAENLEKEIHLPGYHKIIFAGFYALSKTEEKIIQHFVEGGKAEIYWDADSYYFDDPRQEAGAFLRNSRLLVPGFKWKQNDFETLEKNIEFVGVPLQVGQAKAAGSILNELMESKKILPEKTAIVLPDENLLFPVLYSLPESIDSFNVTMGYPLSSTPLFTLFESLILLQKNSIEKENGAVSFYHRHVMNVLNHPSIRQVENEYIRNWLKSFREKFNWIQIPREQLNNEYSPELFKSVFRKLKSAEEMFGYFKKTLHLLLMSIKESEFRGHEIESEYIYHFYVQLQRLEEVISQYSQPLSVDTFWNLLREIIRSSRIPFSGEPLKGLQVMGFLETRLLDFDNLFILSLNEDLLPASSNHPSFIPYNIRKAFRLPTFEDQHAVSSYHFYRLIQRAKNIYLLYNTEAKGMTAGEKSRYLLQIENELATKYPGKINLQSRISVTDFVMTETKPIEIKKTKEVMVELEKYYLKDDRYNEYSVKLSASAFMTYISCPLKFYFQYVAKIREQEEAEENIEAAVFGKILHKAMQLLYGENGNLTTSAFEKLFAKIETVVDQAIREVFRGQELMEGKNILMRNVLVELIRKILKNDQNEAPVRIRFLEQKFFQPVRVSGDHAILLYGIIDRIDEVAGTTRIIDYKTGKVDSRSPENVDELFSDPKFKEHFQIYFYSYLFKKQSPSTPLKSGLLAVKNLSEGIRYVNKGEIISDDQFIDFEDHLVTLIKELFDQKKSFHQTPEVKRCEYCTYKEICQR